MYGAEESIQPKHDKLKREESFGLYYLKRYSAISLNSIAKWKHRWVGSSLAVQVRIPTIVVCHLWINLLYTKIYINISISIIISINISINIIYKIYYIQNVVYSIQQHYFLFNNISLNFNKKQGFFHKNLDSLYGTETFSYLSHPSQMEDYEFASIFS